MIAEWLPPRISSDLSLVSGFLTWIIILGWLWRSGWRVQRRYFIEVTQKPLSRNAIVWGAAIVGAVFFVAAQMRPGMPAVMTVAMIGALSAYVDARTHRLPNMYTVVMGIGVIVGALIGCLISPMWSGRLIGFAVGALIWLIPVAILNRLPGGMGGGDVKLMTVAGLYLGYDGALSALLYGSVLAALSALVLILGKKMTAKDTIPLVPFLYVGILLTEFVR